MKLIFLVLVFSFVNCEDFPWMYLEPYGSNVILKPLKPDGFNGTLNDYVSQVRTFNCSWIGNDLETTIKSDSRKYNIDLVKCELTISNIQESDNGIYHVYLNDKIVSKAMLNYYGPPCSSLVEEYKYNIIAGFAFSAIGGN